jgi:N-methylhydantoinase B
VDAVELSLFHNRAQAVCDEMGAGLKRAAFSPNIKDRLDFSCALFDAKGRLFAQAAHIPVHLGSMAFAMADVVRAREWQAGDMVIFNDPYLGGTHLPDVTLVAPCFHDGELVAFAANRAHHANIGGASPGSMPISRTLDEEGLVIPPVVFERNGALVRETLELLSALNATSHPKAPPEEQPALFDFFAQMSANRIGLARLSQLITSLSLPQFRAGIEALNDYAASIAAVALDEIPHGRYEFADVLDDDGLGNRDIAIRVAVDVARDSILVDFTGTSAQVEGNVNCPMSVTAAAVYYVFRCLMPTHTPTAHGAFDRLVLRAPEGCLVNARRPAAVVAGNVETSMRIVDVVCGALAAAMPERFPAASQGTMNNVAMGARGADPWDYYETVAGGTGGHARGRGLSGVHSHMTNTLNTPVESLEAHYPLRIVRYELRHGSGGAGRCPGGDGLVREFQFLRAAEVTLLTERRRTRPWGLFGGESGLVGENLLNGEPIAAKSSFHAAPGDVLTVMTPGGGGYGEPS